MGIIKFEEARDRYFTRAERRYEAEIAALYRESLDEIRKEMSKIYEKYAVNGILTKAQMTKYNRLATLEKNVLDSLSPAVRASIRIIDRMKPTEYGEAFFRTAWAVDSATRVALTWGPLDKAAIAANLDNPFYLTSTERLTSTLKGAVRNTINNGLALGQSYTEMMKDIKDLVNLKNFETMRILRTELHDAQEAGIADSYDAALEQGINGKVVWIATLDGKTRDSHQEMDGVARDEDGMFRGSIGETPYPGWEGLPASDRINCRCDIRFEIEGFAPEIRRARDDGLVPQQTYDQWKSHRQTFKPSGVSDNTITPLENKELKIVNSKVENGIIADSNGNILAYIEGNTEKNITVPEKYDKVLKDSVFSHNHPTGGGGVFSKGDIAWASGHDVAEIRMVAPIGEDKNNIIFTSMKRPDSGWGAGWWGDNYDKYEKAEEYAFQELVKHQKTGKPTAQFDYAGTIWRKFSELTGTKYFWSIKSVKN